MLTGASLSIVGYIMLISTARPLIQYGGTFLVGAGIFPCSPIVMGWLANITAPYYCTGYGVWFPDRYCELCCFYCYLDVYLDGSSKVSHITSRFWSTLIESRYITRHAINIGVLVLCLIITSTTMLYCTLENRKRDRGERDDRLIGNQNLLGHRHPHFRYTI